MFDDLRAAVVRKPKPASEGRLRAMARQIIRMNAEGDLDPDVWDPDRENELHAVVKATNKMSDADREALRAAMLRELGLDDPARAEWATRPAKHRRAN